MWCYDVHIKVAEASSLHSPAIALLSARVSMSSSALVQTLRRVEESGPRLDYLSGGFLFLRPCKPVEADLIGTASVDEDLKKNIALPGFAEQAFLRWYFPRWGAVSLPEIYNLHWGTFQANNFSTASGLKPLLIHFNNWINREPLMPRPGEPEWPFLCMDRPHAARLSPQQHRRHARHRHNSFEDRLQIGSI